MKRYPTLLSIAGSDSCGGAGIQTDIKIANALGVYAMTAITAVTAQNTCGVRSFVSLSPEMVKAQIDAVVSDIMPDAVKIGMLPNAEIIRTVAGAIREYGLKNVVLDPVMVATSGDSLAESADTSQALAECLAPLAEVVTPNVPEAETFLGRKLSRNPAGDAAELLRLLGSKSVLLKGGHNDDSAVADFLAIAEKEPCLLASPQRIDTPNTHGTGCSLSTAIAAFLALGHSTEEACRLGKREIYDRILKGAAFQTGHGHGPIYQFAL